MTCNALRVHRLLPNIVAITSPRSPRTSTAEGKRVALPSATFDADQAIVPLQMHSLGSKLLRPLLPPAFQALLPSQRPSSASSTAVDTGRNDDAPPSFTPPAGSSTGGALDRVKKVLQRAPASPTHARVRCRCCLAHQCTCMHGHACTCSRGI